MRNLVDGLLRWQAAGEAFALASVVEVHGSAPRRPGAALAVRRDGVVIGSVSGGCVESEVYELARAVLSSGEAATARFGYRDDDALAVGLTCGGEIEVFVQAVPAQLRTPVARVLRAVGSQRPVALVRVLTGEERRSGASIAVFADGHHGSTGDAGLDAALVSEARARLDTGVTGTVWCGRHGERDRAEVRAFVEAYPQQPRLLLFGATDYAAALAEVGRFLGYRVTVCDPRPAFATPQRCPAADEVVVQWPHRYLTSTVTDARTAMCLLTHDQRYDVPLLVEALRRPLGYVGALGSRRTHAERIHRLREAELTASELSRLRSPIGLDLGASTPEETAVSIAAELVALRYGGSCLPLSGTDTPIHKSVAAGVGEDSASYSADRGMAVPIG
ncbi:xanthine dehydrogenase accessory factor [Micromonospora sp. Llam0]|uniref:XdhC family protein n=1 Tax=Micromonospora sp. Llam0 TaxID=2485143 RepID=UPI000F49EA16|nr:XdhC/CoxI family protein [Micromonospora sp. Llam0]ROO62045.1 xanthine dehydrogenase accessory factor [Micromonospora sp. Llam0]